MNGAELSCGTAMGVQPADMNYKEKISKNKGEDGEKILPCVFFCFCSSDTGIHHNISLAVWG